MLSPVASLAPSDTAMVSYYDVPTTDILPLSSLGYDSLCEIGSYTDVAFRSASSATMTTEHDGSCDSAFLGAQEDEEALDDPSWVAVWWTGSSSSSLYDVDPHAIASIDPRASWYENDADTLLSSSTLSVGPDSFGRFWSIGGSESSCDSASMLSHCDDAWLSEEEWKNAAWLQEVHDRRAAQSRPTRAALEAMHAVEERKIKELHNIENWPSLSAVRA